MNDLKGTDGWKRNLMKMSLEGKAVLGTLYTHTVEFIKKPNSHNFVDIFVESLRTSPYFWGHVVVFGLMLYVGWTLGTYIHGTL